MKTKIISAFLLFPVVALAAPEKPRPVLASLALLDRIGAGTLARDEVIGVGYALLTEEQKLSLSAASHGAGKCGGYEALPPSSLASATDTLAALARQVKKDRAYAHERARGRAAAVTEKKPEVVAALGELKAENIRSTVEWLSAFPSRSHNLADPNQHVNQLEAKLRALLQKYPGQWTVDQITHQSTRQKSLRVHLEGKSRPAEIVVLGGHLDSINQSWGGGDAPGADDNASGSASILEALRVFAAKGVPERTVELFWYAGEESGLLGSAEIARNYKAAGKNVVAVLQLDMTMFPGSGQLVIGNVDDFTSAWLRDYLVSVNAVYIGAELITDSCGYGCSDHASWYRQGYPTLMPFESDTEHMNHQIHSAGDVIGPDSSFTHALAFAKIALVMAMDLGNSTAHQTY